MSNETSERIPPHQRQTCKACGRKDKFNFIVPDELWNQVVPEHLRGHVVCLSCFDDFAFEQGIEYCEDLTELWFAGDQACFSFRIRICGAKQLRDIKAPPASPPKDKTG